MRSVHACLTRGKSMQSFRSVVRCALALFLFSSVAGAATIDYRILIDRDNSASTGCAVNGMPGVERVLTTTVDTTSHRVTAVTQQDCSGSVLASAVTLDATGWPAPF